MKFEAKISGTKVTDFQINRMLFLERCITLDECVEKVQRQETMDWLLDNIRFTKGSNGKWWALIDTDSIMKLSILEYYPDHETEMVDYFGKNWLNQYIRFNH